jgi:hypothetical protein
LDQVTGKEFRFRLSTRSIKKPRAVRFKLTNVGTEVQDFRINGKQNAAHPTRQDREAHRGIFTVR